MGEAVRERVTDEVGVMGYGHIGDGNIHLNVVTPEFSSYYESMLEPFVYEYTSEHKGSISAEHGLGQMKNNKILYSKSRESVAVMQAVKAMFDPHGIMNPNKI